MVLLCVCVSVCVIDVVADRGARICGNSPIGLMVGGLSQFRTILPNAWDRMLARSCACVRISYCMHVLGYNIYVYILYSLGSIIV